MIRLSKYMAKYLPFILFGVVLLFGQAILDLNLPSQMSDIVNVGIQKRGIEELAPRVIQPDLFSVLSMFMNEEDFAAADEAYTLYTDLEPGERASVSRSFPGAGDYNVLVMTGEGETKAAADAAFGKAGYALWQAVTEAAAATGGGMPVGTDMTEGSLDYNMISSMVPMLASLPEEALAAAREKAAQTPDTMTGGVAAMLNRAIYESLGADTAQMQTVYILKTGLFMLFLSIAQAGCAVVAGFCFSRFGAGMARDLRGDLFSKVSGFSNAEMDRFSTSSLITRTTNDITQVQMFLTMGLRMLVFAPIMGVGGVVMALSKSVSMSWTIAVGVLVIVGTISILFAVAMPKFKVMQKLVDRLNQVSRENLTGLMVIRAFSNQEFQEERFQDANKNLTGNSLFVGRSMATLMPVMMLVMNGITLLVVWIGAGQIANSQLQVGDMMAYMQYAIQIIMSFLFIAMIFIMVPRAQVSAERIGEVLHTQDSIQDPAEPQSFEGRARGEVRFENVSFRFAGASDDALSGISFTAKPGETTAIIGATGSGKSTLVNLIPRFYDVTEGKVTVDGIDVRQLKQEELRENIGYVPQKGLLFSGTIQSNLRYGDEEASEQTLRRAAEIAQATEFVDGMEEGFESAVSQGGTNFSGGQRQRLSIARALVKKAPVYIFDDSFSALDFATDARLRRALHPYTRQSAVLVVAQRISSIMHAEQIVVLDEGRVAGVGTHRELLQNCEAYREIAESQLSKEELA